MHKIYGLSHQVANRAEKKSQLARGKRCEICGWVNKDPRMTKIVFHHWNGHNNPLDVWRVCYSCNRIFHGCHNGELSKDEAIRIMSDYVTASKASKIMGISQSKALKLVHSGAFPGAKRASELMPLNNINSQEPWLIPLSEVERLKT